MAKSIEDLAKLMGATIVAQLPDVGGGMPGAAFYAEFFRRRQEELRRIDGQQPEPPAAHILEIRLDAPLREGLELLADYFGPPESKIAIQDLALLLVHQSALHLLERAAKQTTVGNPSTAADTAQRQERLARVERLLRERFTSPRE